MQWNKWNKWSTWGYPTPSLDTPAIGDAKTPSDTQSCHDPKEGAMKCSVCGKEAVAGLGFFAFCKECWGAVEENEEWVIYDMSDAD
jgi:hypothetical protein